ncbi:MAG: UDP-N-acetylmuramoyl-tripeptide--D-alanyl-D-alanine ligase [Parcubacteria group bacterium Athens0714_12]|nr:MAG: UDP-N-acetylmuramoyl-tripeptide--D-alanyl-D-alanine ligase [Parcubacteria group bacterium Athens0714_12]
MKKIIQIILKILAIKVLKKYQPEIIAITGSVGKTSTKEAIYAVLKSKFSDKVGRSIKNYNNEIGVPLSVLGCESAKKSLIGWLKIFLHGLDLIINKKKNYPEILILEMAADRIGDIKYLTSFVPRKIAIITSVGKVHLQFFKQIEKIAEEKQNLINDLKSDAHAILNLDDQLVYNMKSKTKAKIHTFGFSEGADIRASEAVISEHNGIKGINFKLISEGKIMPVFLPYVLGKQQVYAALASTCVGIIYKMNLLEISEALGRYRPPLGRMNLIQGIKNSLIIDDTYNASPFSAIAALESLKEISCEGKKIIILGDMLELGNYTEEGHKEVGKKAAQIADTLITVGEMARDIARGAKEAGMEENKIFSFTDLKIAGKFAQDRIKEGDIILIKGSQGARMEKITKELMAEPLKAKELLVRQDF